MKITIDFTYAFRAFKVKINVLPIQASKALRVGTGIAVTHLRPRQ